MDSGASSVTPASTLARGPNCTTSCKKGFSTGFPSFWRKPPRERASAMQARGRSRKEKSRERERQRATKDRQKNNGSGREFEGAGRGRECIDTSTRD